MVDEVFAHRLGMIPLNIPPDLMDMRTGKSLVLPSRPLSCLLNSPRLSLYRSTANDQPTDRNTVVFKLNVVCERNPSAPKDSTDPFELYINHEVLSSHLKWEPAGEQAAVFAEKGLIPGPTNGNIVLNKLRPGQEIDMEMHAIKGVAKDHAKFQAVGAFAHYSLSLALECSFVDLKYSNGIVSSPTTHYSEPIKACPATPRHKIPTVFLPRRDSRRPKNKSSERR